MDDFYRAFGERVRAARVEAGLSQKTLGERVGLTRTSVTNIESGQQHIPLHMLLLLARALGVDPCALVPDEGDVSPVIDAQSLRGLQPDEGKWVRSVVREAKRGRT